MILPDYAIWLVPATFYLLDNVVLLHSSEMLLTETAGLHWRANLIETPFTWRQKVVYLLNPLCPYSTAYKIHWHAPVSHKSPSEHSARRLLRLLSRSALPLRVVACCSFLLLFVAGPAIGIGVGLGQAMVVVISLHLVLVGLTLFHFRFPGGGDGNWARFALAAELTLCPGYLSNISRRYTLQFSFRDADGLALADPLIDSANRRGVEDAISQIMSERTLDDPSVETGERT